MTDTLDAIAREMRKEAETPYSVQTCHSNTLKRWADRITALSNQGEGAWIAFADLWPGESVALDDPSVKTRDTVLVTNGINARDRMGRQTNVWLAAPIQSANEVVAFTDSNQKIHGLTHWKPAFGQAEADRRDAERFSALLSAFRMLVESEPAHITPRNAKEREACKLIRTIVKESDK